MVRTDCHTFDPLFSPPTSAQNPYFYQKLSPKVLFFSHCPEFWKFFTQRPLFGWNLRKRYQNVPYFLWLLSLKDPLFFASHIHGLFRGNVAPSNTARSWKILYSRNRIVQFGEIFLGANLIKAMKIKFQFYRLNRPNCALWMNFIGGQGWYTGYYHPSQTWKGI